MLVKFSAILLFGILNLACFPSFICENTAEKEILSPNGKLKVVIFDRGCGATVGFITAISIMASDEKITNDDTGNIFWAENSYENFDSSNKGTIKVERFNFDARWANDNELKVFYSNSKRLSKKDAYENIKINYELISK